MIGPIVIECPQNVWTQVMAGVVEGRIDLVRTAYDYYQTYRRSGQDAPSDPVGFELPQEAVRMFPHYPQEAVESFSPIDVYVLSRARDQKIRGPGKVRVSV